MSRRTGSTLLVAAFALATTLMSPPNVFGADPVFGKATATSHFGVAITVEQPVTIPAGVVRAEAVIREGIGARTFLATIDTPAPGSTVLRYREATPNGSVYPNTPVELGFRLTFDDGRTVDGPTVTHLYTDDRFTWKTLEGSVVRVHWIEGDAAFGRQLLDIGEKAIKNATTLLGVQETEPIDFFVYADRTAFYDVIGSGVQENVGGEALPQIRTLFANIGSSNANDPWVGTVVPHELTHIVFGTATQNPYHEPLHWLNEGLADYLAIGYDAGARANVANAARSGDLMPLSALVQQFPASADRFSLAYDESVSAIDYIIRTHGRDALVKLIRSYADGVSDDAAFTAALGMDTAGFEAAWLADLGVQAPIPYGPIAAPPGPVPPGWLAAPGATPGPGATGAIPTPTSTVRPGGADGADVSSALTWVGLFVLAFLIVAGILVVARGLSRGDPLLPSAGRQPPAESEAPPDMPSPPADPPSPPADPPSAAADPASPPIEPTDPAEP